ncbi:FG-GAP-like repeat-containing protein, partial [Cellulomonas sp. P5_C6]
MQPGDFGTGDHVDAGFLDGDTHVDIVVDDTLHLDADLGASVGAPVGPDLLRFAIGDVTGDGRADIVNLSLDGVEVIPGRGDGTFDPKVVYPLDRGAWVVRIADMDGDGLQDVVALGDASTSMGHLSVLRQQAGGTLGAPSGSDLPDIVAFFGHPGIAPADLDGDGDLDVVTSGLYLVVSVQRELSDTEGQAWVRAVTPAPHTSGAAARQVVSVTLDRPLRTPVPASVRIVDAAGASVAVNRTYNAATKTIQLTPTADLSPGSHYEVVVDGLTDTSGATQSVPVRTWFTVAAHGDRYTPVDPVRVLDTRTGVGTWEAGRVPAGKALEVALFGLPADATAVVLNVTAVSPSAPGNVRVYPEGLGAPPKVSNINVMPGVDQPNLVTVALGPDHHTIRLLPEATTTHLIADIAGYYSPGAATAFEPLTPTRVMDMRNGTGVRKGALKAGQWVDLSVADGTLVPKDATAVVLNVTGTQVTGPTHVRVYP